MTAAADTVSKFQTRLEQFIKPREQVSHIRRILALQLASYTGSALQPLSLIEGTRDVSSSTGLQGVRKEYIEALQANSAARRQFDEVLQAGRLEDDSQSVPPPSGSELLDQRLTLLKLRQKRECLLAVQRSFDRLAEKPASGPSLLDCEGIFSGARSLPSVPETVVNSFVAEQSSGRPDLQSRVHQLEKTLLQAKLLLRQEERLLAEARFRCKSRLGVGSNGAKLEALNTARNELISWIEKELGKASADESEDQAEDPTQRQAQGSEDDKATIATHVEQIRDKYADYLAARQGLLELVSHHPQPSTPPPRRESSPTEEHAGCPDPGPVNYLLTPYVEALLSVSRRQKAVLTYKSHVNAVLNKQSKNTCQVLSRLAEESQLLPSYPMKESQQKAGICNDLTAGTSDRPDISARVKPWVFAADSAKIATLEAVAETIEGGQVALESCMKSLQNMEYLLGEDTEAAAADDSVVESSDNEVLLTSGGTKAPGSRKRSEMMTGPGQQKGDPWSRLHGNLGLMDPDDAA